MEETKAYTVRTDLAYEAKEMYTEEEKAPKEIRGVVSKQYEKNGIKVDHIEISKEGEKRLKKKRGTYITIFADGVKKQDTEKQSNAVKVLAETLRNLLKQNGIQKDSKGLVVGLGNWNVTPDALGPITVEKVLVTNHLFELEFETVADGYRPVAALSPGVMGVTGMETSDIILSVIDRFKPDFVIVIDALASRSIERINETIQITDTGIHPGSGVGNRRKEVSKETLGVPVIAIGVPTVVDAVTIATDAFDYLLKHIGREWSEKDLPRQALLPKGMVVRHENLSEKDIPDEKERVAFLGLVGQLSEEEKRMLLTEVLTPMGRNMIVTPKEVDSFMNDMAHVVATGINEALHERIAHDEAGYFTR
ncbi:MAG TPA: GPR endopeptidase [Pseudogracilibacillus sp.]|nr:GPR endopeptidase [Pseudogracilibacillus sp.]